MDNTQSVNSSDALQKYEYSRQMGAYKPHFQSIPDDYYPLTCCQVIKYAIFVIGIIGATLGIMIGFIFWITGSNLWNYTVVWSIVSLGFVVLMLILFYIAGRGRIRQEKRRIEQAQIRYNDLKSKKAKPEQPAKTTILQM